MLSVFPPGIFSSPKRLIGISWLCDFLMHLCEIRGTVNGWMDERIIIYDLKRSANRKHNENV